MLIAILFVAGLFIGSFLNVVVMRLHAGKDFVSGRSACPKCGHILSPPELIPLLSWLALRGRCRSCHKSISTQYPLVELLTAVLFALTIAAHSPHTAIETVKLVFWLYITATFVILAIYDLRWYLLPDKVMLPIVVPAVALLIAEAIISGFWQVAWSPLLAGLIFGGGFYALAAVSKGKWMGGGDIKLAFIMGLLLGLQKTSLAMLIAFNSAALIGVILIASGLRKRNDLIPFGPFLMIGTLISYWYGSQIIAWYLQSAGLTAL